MNNRRIDNSFLDLKIKIRQNNLPQNNVFVLDAFHGEGKIWEEIKKTRADIKIIGIEKINKKGGNSIYGDNLKLLDIMDLSKYNVIDLDCYGIPFKQLEKIFKNKTIQKKTIIFYTFIQSIYGCVDKKLLECYGINDYIYNKCPSICFKKGRDAFYYYLNLNKINEVNEITKQNKTYGCFRIQG